MGLGAPTPAAENACLHAFDRELGYIHRTLRRLGTPAQDVDDLALEVFLALRRSWNDYDPDRPLRPFLFGISYRIASVHQRARRRRREVALGAAEVVHRGPAPDDALQRKQAIALVHAALERIPLPRRTALIMHEIDEVPVGEVARALGISPFTVYSRLRKARRELNAALRRLVEDVGLRQTGAPLRLPPGTVASRLRRARSQVRARIAALRHGR